MPPETIEPLEIAMVMLSIAAGIVTGFNLRSAFLDRAATRAASINGPVAMWANAAIWSEVMRMGKAILFLMAGLILIGLPTDLATPGIAWLTETAQLCLVGAAGLMLIAAIHGGETRRLLRESLEPGWDGKERRLRQIAPPERGAH